jgi:hypothetical protein
VLFDCVTTSGLQPIHSPPVCLIDVFRPEANDIHGDQVTNVPKVATQDSILTVNNIDGGKTTFPVPSGTGVDIHVAALHYNRMLSGFM